MPLVAAAGVKRLPPAALCPTHVEQENQFIIQFIIQFLVEWLL